MMNKIWMLLISAGLAAGLTACGENGSGDAPGDTTGTDNAANNGDTNGRADADADDGDHGDHDHDDDVEVDPAEAAADGPEAAVNAFVAAMADGDFKAALELCDPSSEGYQKVNDIIAMGEGGGPAGIVLGRFAAAFEGATVEEVTVDAARARYDVTFPDDRTIPIDLKMRDDRWWIIAPQDAIKPLPFGDGEVPEGLPGLPSGGGVGGDAESGS